MEFSICCSWRGQPLNRYGKTHFASILETDASGRTSIELNPRMNPSSDLHYSRTSRASLTANKLPLSLTELKPAIAGTLHIQNASRFLQVLWAWLTLSLTIVHTQLTGQHPSIAIAQVLHVLPPPLKGVPSGRNMEMLPNPGWLVKSASTIGSEDANLKRGNYGR